MDFYGPFDSAQDAADYLDLDAIRISRDWFVVELIEPNEEQ
jgi:hypothetical protein